MASAEGIKVAIERAVHDAFADVAQRIFDEYRIRTNSVNIGWLETEMVGQERNCMVDGVQINSETFHLPKVA